jgi:hypothetical protein
MGKSHRITIRNLADVGGPSRALVGALSRMMMTPMEPFLAGPGAAGKVLLLVYSPAYPRIRACPQTVTTSASISGCFCPLLATQQRQTPAGLTR